jgi:hypothetical protein
MSKKQKVTPHTLLKPGPRKTPDPSKCWPTAHSPDPPHQCLMEPTTGKFLYNSHDVISRSTALEIDVYCLPGLGHLFSS